MVTPIESLCGVPGAAADVTTLSQDPMAHVFPEVAAARLIKKASDARLAYPPDARWLFPSTDWSFWAQ